MTVNSSPVGKFLAARRTTVLHLGTNVYFAQVSPDVNERNYLSANHADVSSVTQSGVNLHQFVHGKVLKT